jgi:hypothetical protein
MNAPFPRAGFNHHVVFGDFRLVLTRVRHSSAIAFRVTLSMVFRFNPLDWGVFAVSIIIYLRYTYTIMLFFYTLCFIILKYKENKNIDTRRMCVPIRNPKFYYFIL